MKRYIVSTAIAFLVLGGYGAYSSVNQHNSKVTDMNIVASR